MTSDQRPDAVAWPPRLMRLDQAARYLGMSTSSFQRLVDAKEMPVPVKIRGMVAWDRIELDDAIERLKERRRKETKNPVHVLMGIDDDDDGDDRD